MDTLRKTFHWVEKLQIPLGNSGSNEKTKVKIVRKNDRNGQMSVADKTRFKWQSQPAIWNYFELPI